MVDRRMAEDARCSCCRRVKGEEGGAESGGFTLTDCGDGSSIGEYAEETADRQAGEYGTSFENDERRSGPRSEGSLQSHVPTSAHLLEGVSFAE